MMTVVVKAIDNRIIVFTKGADTSIEPCLIDYNEDDRESMRHLDSFADQGLRTLAYAYKFLPSDMTVQ